MKIQDFPKNNKENRFPAIYIYIFIYFVIPHHQCKNMRHPFKMYWASTFCLAKSKELHFFKLQHSLFLKETFISCSLPLRPRIITAKPGAFLQKRQSVFPSQNNIALFHQTDHYLKKNVANTCAVSPSKIIAFSNQVLCWDSLYVSAKENGALALFSSRNGPQVKSLCMWFMPSKMKLNCTDIFLICACHPEYE